MEGKVEDKLYIYLSRVLQAKLWDGIVVRPYDVHYYGAHKPILLTLGPVHKHQGRYVGNKNYLLDIKLDFPELRGISSRVGLAAADAVRKALAALGDNISPALTVHTISGDIYVRYNSESVPIHDALKALAQIAVDVSAPSAPLTVSQYAAGFDAETFIGLAVEVDGLLAIREAPEHNEANYNVATFHVEYSPHIALTTTLASLFTNLTNTFTAIAQDSVGSGGTATARVTSISLDANRTAGVYSPCVVAVSVDLK